MRVLLILIVVAACGSKSAPKEPRDDKATQGAMAYVCIDAQCGPFGGLRVQTTFQVQTTWPEHGYKAVVECAGAACDVAAPVVADRGLQFDVTVISKGTLNMTVTLTSEDGATKTIPFGPYKVE